MAAYGSQYTKKVGMLHRETNNVVESKLAAVAFDFGAPVFYKTGDADYAYAPDSTLSTLVFAGVAPTSQRAYVDSTNAYVAGDQLNVLVEGEVWVKVSALATAASLANKPAYVENVTTATNYGKFSDLSAGGYATGGYFKSNAVTVNGVLMALVSVQGIA